MATSNAEDYILGGSDAPEIPGHRSNASPPLCRHGDGALPAEMPLAQKAEAPKKASWGLFGRKKVASPDMRTEPSPQRVASQPRVNVQPLAPEKPASAPTDDLFPEHGSEEQFEIPAFLRRQSGQ